MARPKSKRTITEEQLKEQLQASGYDKQFYLDQIHEYMLYYDNLVVLNHRLLEVNVDFKTYNEILKEKRQVTKEMRSILSFLKLRPSADEIGTMGSDDDETL